MRLSTKVSLTLVGILILAALASSGSLLVAWEVDRILRSMITDNVSSVRAAAELETALSEQRGLVSSHILDNGNTAWLGELARKKEEFDFLLRRAEGTAHTEKERRILSDLEEVYQDYDERRDEVIDLFGEGQVGRASAILVGDVNKLYGQAYGLCEAFIGENERYIGMRQDRARAEIRRATVGVAIVFAMTIACGVGLLVLFFRGVWRPLRRMADDARAFSGEATLPEAAPPPGDELRAVGYYLRSLMSDVTETQSDLERSRAQLLDADKLATIGRLAASVGHEIRNPLTSLKMRLYSIRQSIGDDPETEEDMRVVAEEVNHLESTIRNFLEFSRPPDLKLSPHDVRHLVDKTLELCGHWLQVRGVRVERADAPGLPLVRADSEQIKQVFLNLFRNSAEAMEKGGRILVDAGEGATRGGQRMVVVRVRDDGGGITPEVRARIFEPFFSTKQDGTGLGLCIAARIMAQHGGRLDLDPPGDGGATFSVWIPADGGADGEDPTRR